MGQIVYFNKEGLGEFKVRLSEFQTARDFITGYFHQHRFPESGFEEQEPEKDWDTFKHFFTAKFPQEEVPEKADGVEKADWDDFKHFFSKELIRLPHPLWSEKVMNLVMSLFVRLFIKINPYGVRTHAMSTYIDLLKKNLPLLEMA